MLHLSSCQENVTNLPNYMVSHPRRQYLHSCYRQNLKTDKVRHHLSTPNVSLLLSSHSEKVQALRVEPGV